MQDTTQLLGQLMVIFLLYVTGQSDDDDDDGVYWLHNKSRGRASTAVPVYEPPVEYEREPAVAENAEPALQTQPTAVPETVPVPSSSRAPMVSSALGNKPSSSGNRRRCYTGPSSIVFKIKIMEQDLKQREQKFNVEMNHLKVMQDLEVAYKKEMNRLMEEELKLKIKILKQKIKDINIKIGQFSFSEGACIEFRNSSCPE